MGRKRSGRKGFGGFVGRWFRRLRRLAVLGGVGAAVYAWWQGRSGGSQSGSDGSGGGGGSGWRAPIGGPRSSSPLRATATPEAERQPVSAVAEPADTPIASDDTASSSTDTNGGDQLATVHALTSVATADDAVADAGAAGETPGTWMAPLEVGGCPASHPVKANEKSGIYHVPGGRFYERTDAQRCYVSADAAEADGYRPAKA
jgi:hypothetical protein